MGYIQVLKIWPSRCLFAADLISRVVSDQNKAKLGPLSRREPVASAKYGYTNPAFYRLRCAGNCPLGSHEPSNDWMFLKHFASTWGCMCLSLAWITLVDFAVIVMYSMVSPIASPPTYYLALLKGDSASRVIFLLDGKLTKEYRSQTYGKYCRLVQVRVPNQKRIRWLKASCIVVENFCRSLLITPFLNVRLSNLYSYYCFWVLCCCLRYKFHHRGILLN